MPNPNLITRRSFLDQSFKTSLAVALSTLVDIPLVMKRALAEGSIGLNGKKILFIWLRGANDALNSVAPVLDSAYAVARPTLALPQQSGLAYDAHGTAFDPTQFALDDNNPLNLVPRTSDDDTYRYANAIRLGNGFAALHPSLKFLAPVYNAGELALIHRVAYPKQSRSHFDSQRYWENGTPNNNLINDGIFYRAILESGLAHTAPLTGVSIQSSLPLILRGSEAAMTNLTDPTRYNLLGVPTPAGDFKADAALGAANGLPFPAKKSRELLELQYQNMQNTLSLFSTINFAESGNVFQDDIKTDGDLDWLPIDSTGASLGDPTRGYFLFPTSSDKNGGWRRPDRTSNANKYVVNTRHHAFFRNLKAAALILNKTDAIIAGTELNGFDTHQSQGTVTGTHPDLNRVIGWSVYALRKYFTTYAERAAWSNVVVVTLSEFGRKTVENSDRGTDHAEAGLMFVAGGGVTGYGKAGRVTGVFNCTDSADSASQDIVPWVQGTGGSMFGANNAYLKRATDFRSILGELIRNHLGATPTQLARIIPGYADAREKLQAGGVSGIDNTPVTGELGIVSG